jgi:hypothetical protein
MSRRHTEVPVRGRSIKARSPRDATETKSEQIVIPVAGLLIYGRLICRIVASVGAAIILLGWFREVYIAQFGVDTAFRDLSYIALFDIQQSLANWFEPILLSIVALLLVAISALARQEHDPHWSRWMALAVVFLALSVDESANLHETVFSPLRDEFGGDRVLLWMSPALVTVALLGLYFRPLAFGLPRRHAVQFIGCGTLFVGGAVGVEMVSQVLAHRYGTASFEYVLAALIEESLEIIGAVLFFLALVAYMRERWRIVSVAVA